MFGFRWKITQPVRPVPPTKRLLAGHCPPCWSFIGRTQNSTDRGLSAPGLFRAVHGIVVVELPFRLW